MAMTEVWRPCALIPTYNHHDRLDKLCAVLTAHSLPVFIVDDGSGPEAARAIDAVAAAYPGVRVERRAANGGKGAAVMTGFAAVAGFSHALQIDADGQHDPAAAPAFLARGRAHPDRLICGEPRY